MSRFHTILTLIRGKQSVVIPLMMAGLVMILMLAVSPESPQYSITVDEFVTDQPKDGQTVRLDGFVKEIQIQDGIRYVLLCHEKSCLKALVPLQITTTFQVKDNVILSGKYHHQILEVDQVLKRCH